MRHPRPRTRLFSIALAVSLSAGICLPAASAFAANGSGSHGLSAAAAPGRVIVRTAPGAARQVASTIRALGGRVTHRMPSIDSLVADLPASALARLSSVAGVESVTGDRHVTLTSAGPDGTDASLLGSLSSVASTIGADKYWRAGFLGQGVDVAVIDSGVSPVEGLDRPGKLVHGPDLSFESQSDELAHLDTYGHGTNMAGIIAGNDTGAGMSPLPLFNPNNTKDFMGIAPAARIVSVKVADAFGNSDVSQVIMGIDWVIRHRDDSKKRLHIRVLNLSFGTDGTQAYTLDPLAYAVEQAWNRGIFVVVSAGNAGYGTPALSDPALDPFIMAVGASEPEGTRTQADDTVATFSSGGDEKRRPDVVAPGTKIISLRVPGSFLDQSFPEARRGDTPRFFRGSGTSQAAAVVSGAAALVLSQRRDIEPDKLKKLLTSTAVNLGGTRPTADGHGEINLAAAIGTKTPGGGASDQKFAPSKGTGSLDGSRGSFVLSADGVTLSGNRNIFGERIDMKEWTGKSRSGNAWDDHGRWMGSPFTGDGFTGNAWEGRSWTATDWAGRSWTSDAWTGRSWTGSGWDGRSWTGRSWTSGSFASNAWSSSSWK